MLNVLQLLLHNFFACLQPFHGNRAEINALDRDEQWYMQYLYDRQEPVFLMGATSSKPMPNVFSLLVAKN